MIFPAICNGLLPHNIIIAIWHYLWNTIMSASSKTSARCYIWNISVNVWAQSSRLDLTVIHTNTLRKMELVNTVKSECVCVCVCVCVCAHACMCLFHSFSFVCMFFVFVCGSSCMCVHADISRHTLISSDNSKVIVEKMCTSACFSN